MLAEEKHSLPKTRLQAILVAVSLAGVALVLLSTAQYGIGLSPDSVGYVSSARNLLSGVGLVNHAGDAFVAQPPLYPSLLTAVAAVLKTDPLPVARVVNAALFGVLLYASGILYFIHSASEMLAIFGVLITLLAIPMVSVAVMAWSELLFIVLVVLCLLALGSFLCNPRWSALAVIALLVVLATLTRYMGVTLLMATALSIVLLRRDSLKSATGSALLLVLVSTVPIGLWLSRNYFLTGSLTGPRSPSAYDLLDNIRFLRYSLYSWLVPEAILQHRFVTAGISVVLLVLTGLAVFLWLRASKDGSKSKRLGQQVNASIVFVIVYASFLLVTASSISQEIDSRLLAPLFVPLLGLLLATVALTLAQTSQSRLRGATRAMIVAAAATILTPNLIQTAQMSLQQISQGAGGFSTVQWQSSETLRQAKQIDPQDDSPIFSNAPDALYILAGINAQLSPTRGGHWYSPEVERTTPDEIGEWPGPRRAYLVWFDQAHRDKLFNVEELKTIADFPHCDHLADGVICTVTEKR